MIRLIHKFCYSDMPLEIAKTLHSLQVFCPFVEHGSVAGVKRADRRFGDGSSTAHLKRRQQSQHHRTSSSHNSGEVTSQSPWSRYDRHFVGIQKVK